MVVSVCDDVVCFVLRYIFFVLYKQPDGCKPVLLAFHINHTPIWRCKSVLLAFHINLTPIWRLVDFASGETSIDYTALRM